MVLCTLTLLNFHRLTPIIEPAVLVYKHSVNLCPRPRGLGPNYWWEQSERCKGKNRTTYFHEIQSIGIRTSNFCLRLNVLRHCEDFILKCS